MFHRTICPFLAIVLYVAVLPLCYGENILAFLPLPLTSHVKGFQPLFLELAARGHNVTVLSPFTVKHNLTNYHEIIVTGMKNEKVDFRTIPMNELTRFIQLPMFLWNFMYNYTERALKSPEVQNLINSDDHYDLVIMEDFHLESTVAIGHRFNAPVVGLAPVPMVSILKRTGTPYNPSYIADYRVPSGKHMTFLQKLKNVVCVLMQTIVEDILYLPRQEELMNKYLKYEGWENRPSLETMLRNVSLHLVHSDSILFAPRPYSPEVIEVSGMHINEKQQLPKDLQIIMDNAKHGVIFFSLGSVINFSDIPEEITQKFIEVFSRLPQVVLWKCDLNLSSVPSNVILSNWYPQTAILKHPNCRLFITHGGLHSVMEAVHFAVPLLGLPLYADQKSNVYHASIKGYGIQADLYESNEGQLIQDINLLIDNSSYKEAAKTMSALYHDKPVPPMETAVYWIEYVIRHKGAPHLKPASVYLKWYQLYLLDVISFVVFVFLITVTLLYYVLKAIYILVRKLRSKYFSKKVKTHLKKS